MRLGIVITDEAFAAHASGLLDAAFARGWQVQCFLTDTGVNLLADAGFLGRARAHPDTVTVCEHSVELHAAGRFGREGLAGPVVFGGQYQNAQLAHVCDQVLVL
ncbi:MAG: hypothetical protein M5U30_11670 [Burkholderiaceae bacterium]|nr:hypothetical protein [Burkholderiaceae bacterium]